MKAALYDQRYHVRAQRIRDLRTARREMTRELAEMLVLWETGDKDLAEDAAMEFERARQHAAKD